MRDADAELRLSQLAQSSVHTIKTPCRPLKDLYRSSNTGTFLIHMGKRTISTITKIVPSSRNTLSDTHPNIECFVFFMNLNSRPANLTSSASSEVYPKYTSSQQVPKPSRKTPASQSLWIQSFSSSKQLSFSCPRPCLLTPRLPSVVSCTGCR